MNANFTNPAALVARIAGRAERFEIPGGDGTTVWRRWGSGPPVVLGHGAQGDWSHFIRNIDALANDRTVWAVDLPGFGESAMPGAETHEAISAALAAGLMELPGLDGPVDLVGFSLGAAVFSYLAALHPELIRRLVIVGPGGLDTPTGHVNLRSVKGLEGEERVEAQRHNLLGLLLHNRESADDLAVHLLEENSRRSRILPMKLVLPDKIAKILPQLHCQVDAIWGEFDRPSPNPTVQEAALRRFQPNCEFRTIPDAGHWVMYERPEAFNRTLLEILRMPLRHRL